MSLLNVSLNFLSYIDGPKNVSPALRQADLSWSLQGLNVGKVRNIPISLAPNESMQIINTARAISFNLSTFFVVEQISGTSYARLSGPRGTFRPAATDGDVTTQWALTVNGTLVRATFTGIGAPPAFNTIQSGYGVTLSSNFAIQNQGDFKVVAVGPNYIEFVNPEAVAEVVAGQIQVYSSACVQIGDSVIVGSAFAFPNQGNFVVTRVTDSFVEFTNPAAIVESVSGVAQSDLVVFPEAYSWQLMSVDGKIKVNFNGDTGAGLIVEPEKAGDIVNSPGLMLKRGLVFRADVTNLSQSNVSGLAMFVE